jgi:predicted glycosyltransferase/MoaA/NifB/PqqE/SkfB family radical SAM enzyme
MHKILIYVQNSYGTGHLAMVLPIARALERYSVYVVYGGADVPFSLEGINIVRLPTLTDSEDRHTLSSDRYSSGYVKKSRIGMLLDLSRKLKPDIVMIEHFPFGRQLFRHEIITLISDAESRGTRIYSLFRGIIGQSLDEAQYRQLVEDCALFDSIFVLSDPELSSLEKEIDTLPFRNKLLYTGFSLQRSSGRGGGTVVNCGSGRDAGAIVDAVRLIEPLLPAPVRIFEGIYGQNKHVEKDITAEIAGASLIISTAGYNSAAETLLSTAPTVLVPVNREQELRAERFASSGLAVALRLGDLSEGSLRSAIERARPKRQECNMDGAAFIRGYIDNQPIRIRIDEGSISTLGPRLHESDGGAELEFEGDLRSQRFYQEIVPKLAESFVGATDLSSGQPAIEAVIRHTQVIRPVLVGKIENRQRAEESFSKRSAAVVHYPTNIYVELTRNCNSCCIMCPRSQLPIYQRYDKGLNMPFELFKKVADELFPYAYEVDLRGFGESTMLPDLGRYLDYAARFDTQYLLVTNLNVRNDDLWKKILGMKFILGLSIDGGTKETYEKIRRGSRFDSFLHNLSIVRDSGMCGSCSFMVCVQKDNIHELGPIIDLASEYGITEVELSPATKPEFSIFSLPKESVRDALQNAISKSKSLGVKLNISGSLGLPELERTLIPSLQGSCMRPWTYAYIMHDGRLGPCNHRFNPPLVFGDLNKQSFMEAWNSPGFQVFRSMIDTEHRFEKCDWCYGNRYY